MVYGTATQVSLETSLVINLEQDVKRLLSFVYDIEATEKSIRPAKTNLQNSLPTSVETRRTNIFFFIRCLVQRWFFSCPHN